MSVKVGIRDKTSTGAVSKAVLSTAHEFGLISMLGPVDMTSPTAVRFARDVLDRWAEVHGGEVLMPADTGMYYLVRIPITGTKKSRPALIPEGKAADWMTPLGVAAGLSDEQLSQFTYREGVLPV